MSVQLEERDGIRVAVEGCGHGALHAIYASITHACELRGWRGIDLVIVGGDFEAIRNAYDLNCVSVPAKYRHMCDFHEYYSGQRTAPCLTVFVGGNHEASNHLFELYYGGWVAPNIYYMGAANVLQLGPLRIAGLSGIWKGYSYKKPHYERLPYNESDIKSIYHVRELDTRKLLQVRTQVDIGISHDWPRGVEWKGDFKALFRGPKQHLEEDARNGQLGSVAAKLVMDRLRPRYWFSAHLHCKYAALIRHGGEATTQKALPITRSGALTAAAQFGEPQAANGGSAHSPESVAKNEDEINLDLDDEPVEVPTIQTVRTKPNGTMMPTNADEVDLELEDDTNGVAPIPPGQGLDAVHVLVPSIGTQGNVEVVTEPSTKGSHQLPPLPFDRPQRQPQSLQHPPAITNRTTHFLALDKCLPSRDFLQLLSVPAEVSLDPRRPLKLEYDREWLAITRAFALSEPLILGDTKFNAPPLQSSAEYAKLVDEQRTWIDQHVTDEQLVIPENFTITAPVYDGGDFRSPKYGMLSGGLREYTNPQTSALCEFLGLPNPFAASKEEMDARMAAGPKPDPNSERFGGRGRGRGRGRGGGRGDRGRGTGGGDGRGRWHGR